MLPASLGTGSYYVLSVADPASVVAETIESNNVRASAALKIGPDLVVAALTSPTRAPRGATITITETTRNQGGSEAGASITRYYLSLNGAVDAGDVPLGSRAVTSLGPGAFSAVTVQLTIPPGTATGSFYVIARTDDANTVVEVTETNNTRVASLRVDP
jgi:subtilase family serine protease